jgi:membrane protease YdiL (CAAX protease family)
LFIGLNGVRSGWRVLLFYAVFAVLISSLVLVIRAVRAWLTVPHQPTTVLTPGRALLNEGVFLFGVLVTSAIFARFERRSFADYGLPVRGAFGARFLEGLLWGVALISCVLLVLRATDNFYFGSINLTLEKMAVFAVVWAAVFAMVGMAEGFAFSGYPLFALARGLGFWPAAALLAVFFGSVHIAVNAGENWLGSVSLVIVGLLLAFTLQRTGSLWFAIGIHAAWDWGQSFLYGVPDSGITVAHRRPLLLIAVDALGSLDPTSDKSHSLTRSRLPSSRRHRYTINGVISPVLGLVPKVTVPGLSRR